MENSDTQIKLFTHPACACGPTIDLVNSVVNEIGEISMKEISLVTKDGRKAASAVGVKTIPSVLFVKTGVLLVTSVEITRDRLIEEIKRL